MATLKSTARTATARTTTKKSTSTSDRKIKHTFPDGTEFTGTIEQLQKVSETLGFKLTGMSSAPRGYYPSVSRGLVKISEMNDYHIRRALLKRSKDYFTEIFDSTDTNGIFLKKFTGLTEDSLIVDLYTELANRK
jgi:hypothetical protein